MHSFVNLLNTTSSITFRFSTTPINEVVNIEGKGSINNNLTVKALKRCKILWASSKEKSLKVIYRHKKWANGPFK